MEKRQLNFNQPLLSVRRGSAQPEINRRKTHDLKPNLPPLPYYKSELKSGPVRNPGVVPFQWEQMPGRPKDENKAPKDRIRQLAVAPKLPPGKIINHKQEPIDKTLKGSPDSSSRSQTGNIIPPVDISSAEKGLSEFQGSEKETKDKDISSSDDDNVTFVDAPGTLSRTESFFNCSTSGVSGLDDPSMPSCQTFADPQTRDFMMGRFLPAAKAVASETPHFSPRRHSAARKQSEPVKRVIKWKTQSPQYALPHNIHGEEEDDHEQEDDYDEMEVMPAKLCGLLPSFCLLNPIPGMRDAQAISSVRSVRTRPANAETSRKSGIKDKNNFRKEMKKVPHQHASKKEPSISKNFSSQSIAPQKGGSPHVILSSERRYLGLPQECTDLRTSKPDLQNHGGAKSKEVISLRGTQETTRPANPDIEKTLYVDSDHMEQSRDSISSSTESRGRNPSIDSLQDIKSLSGVDEKHISRSKSSDTGDSSVVSTPENSFQDVGEDFQRDKDFNLAVVVQRQKADRLDVKEAMQERSLLTLGPLLPKSPSESWLSRTLPSMSMKNSSSKLYLGHSAFRSSNMDPNRERMLRAKNLQLMAFQHVRELAPILES